MTVVSLQQARLKRANQRPGCKADRERERIAQASHSSLIAFEQSARKDCQLTCLSSELEGNPGADALHFLRSLNQVNASNAALILSVADFWAQVASNILHQSRELLHKALSVSTAINLGRGEQSCRARRGAETFGPDRTSK
jgi:hypothetical protein